MSFTAVTITDAVLQSAELKYTQKQKPFANVELGIAQGYGNKASTETIKVTAWEGLAEQLAGLDVGTKLNVYGRLNARSYEYQGKTIRATDIVAEAISVRFTNTKPAANEDVPF